MTARRLLAAPTLQNPVFESIPTVGLLAAMPATGTGSGALYYATDDAAGTLYLDTAAGVALSPVSSRAELFSATLGSDFSTGTTTTWVDIVGLTLAVSSGSRPLEVRLFINSAQCSASDTIFAGIYNATDAAFACFTEFNNAGTNAYGPGCVLRYRIPANTAQKIYKAQTKKANAGTLTINAPAYLSVVEL